MSSPANIYRICVKQKVKKNHNTKTKKTMFNKVESLSKINFTLLKHKCELSVNRLFIFLFIQLCIIRLNDFDVFTELC